MSPPGTLTGALQRVPRGPFFFLCEGCALRWAGVRAQHTAPHDWPHKARLFGAWSCDPGPHTGARAQRPAITAASGSFEMPSPPHSLTGQTLLSTQQLPWPLPALLAWGAGWALWWAAAGLALGPAACAASGLLAALVLAARCQGRWRRLIAAAGFPLSAWAVGGSVLWPPWAWLLLALPLIWFYPPRAWRDAPFFPTPINALQGLAGALDGPPPRRVLDAGCGLGHGLAALRRIWPQAHFTGLEWSRPLAWATARRCPWAVVARGDMWAADWSAFDVVYLFQRPESMARAYEKALAEMAPGSHLVSLEFAVPQQQALFCLAAAGQRSVWVYRLPGVAPRAAGSTVRPSGR